MLHNASSSKPEAFDINVHELTAQKTSFDDDVSRFVAKQRSSDRGVSFQSVDTVSSAEADLYPKSVIEQHYDADDRCSRRLPTPEAISVIPPRLQHVAEDNVQFSRRKETADSSPQSVQVHVSEHFAEEPAELCTPDFPEDQRLASADSTVDDKPTVQQMPETRPLVADDQSRPDSSVREKHLAQYQGDQLTEEHGEVQEAVQEKIEQRSDELAFSENSDAEEVSDEFLRTAVCVDDFTGDDNTPTLSFAVCSEEPSAQELERQPVFLCSLSESALTAVVDDVPRQTSAEADTSATHVDCCIEPIVYDLPVEESEAYDLEVSEIDAEHAEMSESGNFAEAAISLPETGCGVRQLTSPHLFDEFAVRLQSPETVTCLEVQVPEDLLRAVESRGIDVATSAAERMTVVGDSLPLTVKPAVVQTQCKEMIVKSDDSVQREVANLPEKSKTAEHSTPETFVESEEICGAESIQQPGADLPMTWKYRCDDRHVGSHDSDEAVPGLEAKYRDSYWEQHSMRLLMEEGVAVRTPFDFAHVELEYEYPGSDGDDEEDTDSATSDEWCLLEKEHYDFGLSDQTQERVLADVGDVSRLAEQPVGDSSTHETSSAYRTNTAFCTSNRRL